MNNDAINIQAEQLSKITAKTKEVIAYCQQLQQEVAELSKTNETLQQTIKLLKIDNNTLKEQFNAKQLAQTLHEPTSDEKMLDMKKKINELVAEIDKCVVLLKK